MGKPVNKTGRGQMPQREPLDRRGIAQGGEWLVLDSKRERMVVHSLVEVMGRWKAIVEGGDRA